MNAQRIRTDKDVRGYKQKRDLGYAQISSLNSCTRMYNCSTAPRMAVVPRSSVFALQTRRYKMYTEVHFVPCLRLIFARALYLRRLFQKAYGKGIYCAPLLKILNVSERTGMSVVPCSSVFVRVLEKNVRNSTHCKITEFLLQ